MNVVDLGESMYYLFDETSWKGGQYWQPTFGISQQSFTAGQVITLRLYLAFSANNSYFPSCLSSYDYLNVLSCDITLSDGVFWKYTQWNTTATGNGDLSSTIQDAGKDGYHYYIITAIVRFDRDVTTSSLHFEGRLVNGATSFDTGALLAVDRMSKYSQAVSLVDLYSALNGSNAISDAIDNQTEQQAQQYQDTQDTFDDAQDSADTDSSSSSSEATSSGTTLLAGFQSFLGALTGASPSNCVINADLGNMDLGNMDLCQLDPPPAFQAISSIMVIGFTVPLSIALGRKMIALFRSFQT